MAVSISAAGWSARTDTRLTDQDTLTVEGDLYTGRNGTPLSSLLAPGPVEVQQYANLSGGYVQSIWNHTHTERSDMTLDGSYGCYTRGDCGP